MNEVLFLSVFYLISVALSLPELYIASDRTPVLIHIPKTGGASIADALLQQGIGVSYALKLKKFRHISHFGTESDSQLRVLNRSYTYREYPKSDS